VHRDQHDQTSTPYELTESNDSEQANFDHAADALNTAAADAVATLRAGLFSESPATRIREAVAILNLAITTGEIRALEDRLFRVEQRTKKNDA
jgi:hypothetical protein